MSKKIFKTLGKIAGVVAGVALIGSGIGSVLGGTMVLSAFGATVAAGTIATIAGAVSLGASLLGKPKAVAMNNAALDRLNASINPRAPHIMVFGRTAMATEIRDQEFTGTDKEYLHRFFVVASHKVNSVQQIWFDDKLAWTSTGGVQGEFAGYLTVAVRTEGAPGNAINISSRMGSARRFTGLAYVHLRYKLTGNSKKTESPFAQQVPTRMTIVGEGIPCYDPRQDSTVPGGSGSHRANNQATWTYGPHARNPACQLATWLLGWRIQNPATSAWRLIVGKGIPGDRIDWTSFIEAANLCDEPVALIGGGTEPRYRGDGLVTEADDPMQVLEAFKACMNADLDDQDGLLRITVFHNDLATPDADLGDDDIEGPYTWIQTPSLADSFNVVRGGYIEPSERSLYQQAEYSEARLPSPDGIDRIHPADFSLVQSKSQAERLAKQRLQRQQYGGTFRATFLATGWKVQKNSVVRITCGSQGWTNKLFRVVETAVQFDGLVPMVLREEHAQIYAWDRNEGPAPQIAEPTYYAPGEAPIPQFLGTIEEGATVGAPNGTPVGDRPAEQVTAEIDQLAIDLAQLDIDIAGFDSAIAAAESHITDLLGDMADAKASILAAQGEIVTVQDTVATLGATVDTVATAISNVEGDMASLSFQVSTLGAQVGTYSDAISTLESDYATLTSTVTTLGSTVDSQATAITTLDANYAGLTAEVAAARPTMNQNPRMQWRTGDTYPTAWSNWIEPPVSAELRGDGPPEQQKYVRLYVDQGVEGGLMQTLPSLVTGYYVIEADVVLSGGFWFGSGLTMSGVVSLDFGTEPDANGLVSGAVLGRRYFSKLVHISNATWNNFHIMAGWGGFAPSISAKHLDVYSAGIRHASAEEIRSGTALPALQATVTTQAEALTTLDSQYASLNSTVSTQGVTIDSYSSAISGLNSNVTTLFGRAGVRVDVNGRVTGWETNNNGTVGDFKIHADYFSIEKPGGGARLEWSGGNQRTYDPSGNLRVRIGVW